MRLRLRLANGQKLVKKDDPRTYLFNPILHLWKNHSLQSWEIWGRSPTPAPPLARRAPAEGEGG